GDHEVAAVLFAAIRKLGISGFGHERRIPIDLFCESLNFRRSHSGGIHRTDDASHTGAGDAVHGDVIFFHPLDDADFGETERASATEGESDTQALSGRGGRRSDRCVLYLCETGAYETKEKDRDNQEVRLACRHFHQELLQTLLEPGRSEAEMASRQPAGSFDSAQDRRQRYLLSATRNVQGE